MDRPKPPELNLIFQFFQFGLSFSENYTEPNWNEQYM